MKSKRTKDELQIYENESKTIIFYFVLRGHHFIHIHFFFANSTQS
jgi:hypothetical protein